MSKKSKSNSSNEISRNNYILDFFRKKNRVLLSVFFFITAILFIYCLVRLRTHPESFLDYLPFIFAFTHGLFVIGDTIIIGLFWMVASVMLFIKNDYRYTFLVFLLFHLIRNAGEVIYWFNYQFALKDPHPTRNQFEWLSGPLPIENAYILYQLTNQMFVVLWIFLLFTLIKNWKKVK